MRRTIKLNRMEFQNIYFLGIGGIGMSALARYFLHEGKRVAGYDRTPSHLTDELAAEGAEIHFEDDVRRIPAEFLDPAATMVVYTPAVPQDHGEYQYFVSHGFCVEKRSQMLGHLAEGKYVMAVAGTHGKTTTSTLVAWLNRGVTGGGSAFLGGISKNFGGNLVLGAGARLAVEADEFDRSFLRLYPDVAVITSADADHLDIYGTHEAVKEAFSQFVRQIRPGGFLIIKEGVDIVLDNPQITVYRYSYDVPCDFYARNVQLLEGGHYRYDIVTPGGVLHIDISQRRPLLRLLTDGVDSYVTPEGYVFAAPRASSLYVPVVTGAYRPPFPASFVGSVRGHIDLERAKIDKRIAELEREKYPFFRRELQNDRNISALRRMRIKKQWWRMESSAAFDARVEELRARKAELRRKYRYEARLVQEGIDRIAQRQEAERLKQKKLEKSYEDFMKLLTFVEFIEDDDFWRSEVVQIAAHTTPSGALEVELVPRSGRHTIVFGRIEQVERKFDKLLRFYRSGLMNIGWGEYRTIDIRYNDQVVCKK